MVKGTHRGSVKDGGAVRLLGGAETSRRGRATAPRRQQPPHGHGVGRQSPSFTPRRGRRQSPSAIALFLLSKKGKHVRREATGLRRPHRVSNATSSRCNMLGSVVLTLDLLRQITNNFSDDQDQLLGEGAFGKVYKGVLPNGDTIAVKRFASTISGLQDVQYENEAQHLMWLKHPNIVQLVGYCCETEMKLVWHNGTFVRAEEIERLLCLEYMPKGSLRDRLSDKTSRLEWATRYKIIEGICNGLHYLHEEWQATPIIHMDLKPANILLDGNMVPKIADFGLSRLLGEDQTRTITTSCKGTRGYMPPEYVDRGVITKMFDIFSLGVIIIEIITGLKDYPTDETATASQRYIDLVLNNWRHGLTKAQGYTSQDIDYQQMKKCIQIGLLCVKFDPVKRPTMNQIIKMLEGSDEAYQNERDVVLLMWHPSVNGTYAPGLLVGRDAWTVEENKLFEKALELIDWNSPDRWEKVAQMLPSKTVADVMRHYDDLENEVGLIEAPGLLVGRDAWTVEENKLFEKALEQIIDCNAPDRWEKVAQMLPSKMVADVMRHCDDLENEVGLIEAGLMPILGAPSTTGIRL